MIQRVALCCTLANNPIVSGPHPTYCVRTEYRQTMGSCDFPPTNQLHYCSFDFVVTWTRCGGPASDFSCELISWMQLGECEIEAAFLWSPWIYGGEYVKNDYRHGCSRSTCLEMGIIHSSQIIYSTRSVEMSRSFDARNKKECDELCSYPFHPFIR